MGCFLPLQFRTRILQGTKGKDVYINVPEGVSVTDDKNKVLG